LPVAIMMDDSLARIRDRVTYIAKIWAGTFEDYQMRHFVQRLDCTPRDKGMVAVESNFLVAYTTARGRSEILVSGTYEDEIELAGGDAKFRAKKAVLDTVTTPRYLVYPI
jgi:anthranilate 1,2-dioxygenase small subunit